MAASLSNRARALVLVFSVLLFLSPSLAGADSVISYHGGPILTGNLNLGLVWYGKVGRKQKTVIRRFINSLNYNGGANLKPQVSSWWKMVESYQSVVNQKAKVSPKIRVRVAKQTTDPSYSVGKILTKDFITPLAQKASGGDPNTVIVIFAARDVTVDGLCMGRCADHGVLDKQPYIMVGNPESECPGVCAWPFHKADYGPQSMTLDPPNGNVGADAMVIAFAAGLAETVTNPFNTGFFKPAPKRAVIEVVTACPGMFGTGALPGYTGKVLLDPTNGGAFNAHGARNSKFLIPAIWNPRTSSCWTPM